MIKTFGGRKYFFALIGIFLIAIIIRFRYFPNDISFTYDQARDAFIARKLFAGDLKIVGPPSTFEGISHGPLFYYLSAPLYFLSHGNPAFVSAFLRTFNALGVFLIFLVATSLFNKSVGILSAIVYAFSFEQSQYALFLGHPAPAVLTVLLFYCGLSLLFFKKQQKGLIISLLGLGLSIQFHFSLIVLFIPLFLLLFIFRKQIPKLDKKTILLSTLAFLITTSSFFIAELKFNFRQTHALQNFFFRKDTTSTALNLKNIFLVTQRFLKDNFYQKEKISAILSLILALFLFKLLRNKKFQKQSLFLLIWLIGGLSIYLFDPSSLSVYHYAIGASLSLIILTSFLLFQIFSRSKAVATILLSVVIFSNIAHISKLNPQGTIVEIISREGMLLTNQKKAIDFIYQSAGGNQFSINALTVPYQVNTTWDYLFEWYGLQKYGYLPVWGGNAAEGFEGNLPVETARSKLPEKRFLILEPAKGLESWTIDDFLNQENLFTEKVGEKKFGEIVVQIRSPK